MQFDQLKQIIGDHLACELLEISGDGRHFDAVIVSQAFEGLSTLKRQQKVYAILNDWIRQGQLHAFSMKTYTPEEWARG